MNGTPLQELFNNERNDQYENIREQQSSLGIQYNMNQNVLNEQGHNSQHHMHQNIHDDYRNVIPNGNQMHQNETCTIRSLDELATDPQYNNYKGPNMQNAYSHPSTKNKNVSLKDYQDSLLEDTFDPLSNDYDNSDKNEQYRSDNAECLTPKFDTLKKIPKKLVDPILFFIVYFIFSTDNVKSIVKPYINDIQGDGINGSLIGQLIYGVLIIAVYTILKNMLYN